MIIWLVNTVIIRIKAGIDNEVTIKGSTVPPNYTRKEGTPFSQMTLLEGENLIQQMIHEADPQ